MRFNKYIWNLYKDSTTGKETLDYWKPLESFPNEKYAFEPKDTAVIDTLRSCELNRYIIESKVNFHQLRHDYFRNRIDFSKENIRDLYSIWIQNGLSIDKFVIFPANDTKFWTHTIEGISTLFYNLHPDYFFPYIFECEFNKLSQVCLEFNIPIPEVPKKSDWFKRALYYLDLCDAFFEFRQINGFTPSEFCAFLYDFAPKNLEEIKDTEMPKPSKVWFVGCNKFGFDFLDNATESSTDSWQCNQDTRRGDIIIMYCLSPRSYIHSIWRAESDGFLDPFFHYFNVGYISSPLKLDYKISQKDLNANPVWSNNPLIRKNLQGINGYPIKYNEYLELLSLLQQKGQQIDLFPLIKTTTRLVDNDLINERDVEIKLIEPLFIALGYSPNDWLRQMPVKMGRGECYYPDYCFNATYQRGDEKAKMLVESKYEIKTQKDLQDAYFQTKSYALRLQSDCFVIAAKEGIWIFLPKNSVYSLDNCKQYSWIDIENPDNLHDIRKYLGTT
jgi:hypothetical protein